MEMIWLFVIVTAIAPGEFETRVISQHETVAECYVTGTQSHWEEKMPINSEAVCILVEGKMV